MSKTVTIRIDDETYKKFVSRAESERRSLGKFIENAALIYSEQAAFACDEEMREINSDKGLMRRMRQGISDAKRGRGRFVA